jgi:hypothetical protein
MFHSARRLLHLAPAAPVSPAGETTGRPAAGATDYTHRHPAMRGLNVPPVHGRHCICNRCNVGRAA